ncbi:MAG TPA: TetR/AcrR family transcriptional regulator [Terracidiphilus sp.]|nr:TetR/AcrR family transcriptional regulator [Terracidiphilus sp.]
MTEAIDRGNKTERPKKERVLRKSSGPPGRPNSVLKPSQLDSKYKARRGKSGRPPGRPTLHSGLYAREKLIEAATELFAKQGVAATTFAMIAERAHLTPAMLHYYFRDREQLLDAVAAERLAPLIRSVWQPVDSTETPAEILSGVVERMLAGIEKMPWVPSTWMREVLNDGGLLRGRVLRYLPFEKIGLLSQSVAPAQVAGAANPEIDAGLTVFSAIGLVMMHMATIKLWSEIFGRKAPSREALSRHIKSLLLHGLQPSGVAKDRGRLKRTAVSMRK